MPRHASQQKTFSPAPVSRMQRRFPTSSKQRSHCSFSPFCGEFKPVLYGADSVGGNPIKEHGKKHEDTGGQRRLTERGSSQD